ncbi:MAG: NUDIX hydrolase [Streptosporangiaceae bacterium]
MPDQRLMAEPDWHASLPGVVVTAAGLIGDGAGRVLVVKPNYRDYWTLPGGICEFGEAPQAGCAREVAEEIGLALAVGRLLAVDWRLPLEIYGPQARPSVHFIFDCGVLASLAGGRLQAEELDDWRFAPEPELAELLPPAALPRVLASVRALSSGCTRYVPEIGSD